MRFRRNKVWAEADADGRPLQKEGLVRIKYQLDQPHEYRVKAHSLRALDDEGAEATAERPRTETPAAAVEGGERMIHVYTDGAASGNPGPAGIGVVLRCGDQRKEISEYIGEATNNVAELLAIQKGLAAVRNRRLPVRVYTDSSYARGVLALGWKPKKNLELITAIRRSMARFGDLRLIKVPGHQGVPENERADELATSAIRKRAR
jgi:ribonuclease HI